MVRPPEQPQGVFTRPATRPAGRPRSTALTARLLSSALDMLAEEGLGHLTFEALSRRAGAGKAGLYRRWPSVPALVDQALRGVEVIPGPPADQGSLTADLLATLQALTHPPTRECRAACALIGAAHTDAYLHHTLHHAVVQPLQACTATVFTRQRRRGHPVPDAHITLSSLVIQALWWDLGTSSAPPLTADDLQLLVDNILVPANAD